MKSSGIGGQAVIEGIMMRNKDKYSVAVRKPDNEIEVIVKESKLLTEKHKWLNIPIVRGVCSFIDSLVTGVSIINYSATFYEDPNEQKRTRVDEVGKSILKDKFESVLMALTVILSIFLAVGLFVILPTVLRNVISHYIVSAGLLNFIEGLIRLVIFILYVTLISLMKDIKRTFMYHGAEHKCINCLENGARLTPENVKNSSRYHKRCGTSFLVFVMVVSIVVFSFIIVDNIVLQVALRLLLVPVVAGLSYELIKFAGSRDNAFVKVISLPGMWVQKLTTKEPDMDMIEVAIKAVDEVFDWKEFLTEYYAGTENPIEELVASEAELAISKNLDHTAEETRTISSEETEEAKDYSEMTAEEKYIQAGKEFGMNEDDRDMFSSVYEISDESESTVFDHEDFKYDFSFLDEEEETPEEFKEIFEEKADYDNPTELSNAESDIQFEEVDNAPIDDYEEEIPMFKQRSKDKKN